MSKAPFLIFSALLLLAGCTSVVQTVNVTPTPEISSMQPTPSPTATNTPVSSETPAPAFEVNQICSPLAGVPLEELGGHMVNGYNPPQPGSDDPHQGIDLAVLSAPGGIALSGAAVQTLMTGKVAGVANNRFPYGNSLMIEVPLDEVSPDILSGTFIPTPLPLQLPPGALTCPDLTIQPSAAGEPRSLYILYAHMQNPVEVEIGDPLGCGQMVGTVGESGNALNPHLHIEVRVGPAGQTFPSMAHYDPSANEGEMAAYCTWRVSGVFQAINPACLWGDCQ